MYNAVFGNVKLGFTISQGDGQGKHCFCIFPDEGEYDKQTLDVLFQEDGMGREVRGTLVL